MLDYLFDTITRVQPVHVARTSEERSAIFRQRYDAYVTEKNSSRRSLANHELREIHAPEDDLPESTLFYIGDLHNLAGSMRTRVWSPGQIPADVHKRHSLSRLPDIDTRTVCNVSFLVARPTFRGTAAVVALTSGAGRTTIEEHGVEVLIADCAPGLLTAYRRLGLRPYGAALICDTGKITIPLVAIVADLEHSRRCKSPWYPTLRRLAAQGKLPTRDFSALLAPLSDGGGIESDPRRVVAAIEAACTRHRSPFLLGLPQDMRTRLAGIGHLFDIAPGLPIFDEGYIDRDIFVVLEGELELRFEGVPVKTLRAGEVFGEVAFARAGGRRSGSVFTASYARLLHLRHGALRRHFIEHPTDGVAFYAALCEVLADRLVAWTPGNGRQGPPSRPSRPDVPESERGPGLPRPTRTAGEGG